MINPSVAAQNVRELVALGQASPGKLNYASAGVGTPIHLAAELFKTQTGTNIVHVAYKGAAPAATDLLSGQVQITLDNPPAFLPYVRSGKVRAIATMGGSRFPLLPDVPTLTESGFRNAEAVSWFAIVVPKGTTREIVVKLNAEFVKPVNRSDIRQKFLESGGRTGGQFTGNGSHPCAQRNREVGGTGPVFRCHHPGLALAVGVGPPIGQ